MRVAIDYGRQRAEVELTEDVYVESRVASPPRALADPAAAVRGALEQPFHFPPLRRALTLVTVPAEREHLADCTRGESGA